MTPITARSLLQEWLDTNSLEGQYVPLAKYEAMRQKRLELGETVSRLMEDNRKLIAGLEATKSELVVTEALLNERQRLLDAIPECEAHGPCVPHALNWVVTVKSILQRWATISPIIFDIFNGNAHWQSSELRQLITDTQAILPNSTSEQSTTGPADK